MPLRRRRPCALAVAFAAALALLPAGAAPAQTAVLATNGSSLQAPANLALPGGANQCAARPYIGLGAGSIQFIPTNQTTCMWWSSQYGPTGQVVANTYVPRGAGAVTRVRVRSGAAPAQLQFAVLGSGGGLCCTTKQASPPVQPLADQVTEFAVNLPAGSGVGDTPGSQYNDILVIAAVGPGSLPVNDRGAHGFLFGSAANQAQAAFLHPALALGASNTDVGIMDGYEVLLQYDWCGVPMTGSNLRPVAPADPTTACLPGASTPLGAISRTVPVRDGVAGLRLRCLLRATCSGSLRLLPRNAGGASAAARRRRAVVYGGARFRIAAGRGATVGVHLSPAGRGALRRGRRSLPVTVEVTTSAGRTTLRVTLTR
ncbi:hypothetical protein VSS74_02090 [Conexibacter stalactiti]|uniref:Uncharacterized protein n=1 Tax=Conexibacter stalactiti TaxID=1940611 RepID=A0ABU4HIG8_9ACTN|nr:hypothetical protein [Conexibacter stalactiti]MDW5593110.1 hypothetical protein [Conexibacter stalactiti]MEC5033751.1 hypothetical protein [Conexibacter stalactiti]